MTTDVLTTEVMPRLARSSFQGIDWAHPPRTNFNKLHAAWPHIHFFAQFITLLILIIKNRPCYGRSCTRSIGTKHADVYSSLDLIT